MCPLRLAQTANGTFWLAAGLVLLFVPVGCAHGPAHRPPEELAHTVADPEIRAGVETAVFGNLLPAATERDYPGYFNISADGAAFGGATWPGLDSWQMAGAYLLLGRTRLVLDYFDFVLASQRKDGNIPFAIFPGDTQPGGCLRGLKTPDDIFAYTPPKRAGLPAFGQETRRWIGLFEHWQTKGYPLSTLGPVCYILTAAEIFDATGSRPWLKERLPSIEAAAKYLLTLKRASGLLGGSGFYIESPPREGCDGVTQCYAVHAFRELARLWQAGGDRSRASEWAGQADRLTEAFLEAFWREDHFGEYVHPERGLIDSHGLTDVNWAAVAFGVATGPKLERVWTRLTNEAGFWWGGMPTQNVTRPFSYEAWETQAQPECGIDPLNDVAAMGRAWYLEVLACRRMRARDRLIESVRRVCRAAAADGYWRERYHPKTDGSVSADGARKYCEYPAVLIRAVYGHQDVFWK
jgi:Mannosylglycerate hydrolase MGH1-like glycoside hydrolase domain